jgi:hypothetical protein
VIAGLRDQGIRQNQRDERKEGGRTGDSRKVDSPTRPARGCLRSLAQRGFPTQPG